MERNSDKRRRPKNPTGQSILPINRYRDAAENVRAIDQSWKYCQSNEIDANNRRNERKQSNPAIDYNKNYYGCIDVPRTSRRHGVSYSSRVKHVVPQSQENFQNICHKERGKLRQPKDEKTFQDCIHHTKYAKNVAVGRKNYYVDDLNDFPELDDSTFHRNGNLADETSEGIVDEEHLERLAELKQKDYQEHEVGDEIVEEPDVLDRSLDKSRLHRKLKVESCLRNHNISSAPPAPRFHRTAGKKSDRCCRSATGRAAEIPTEEEEEEESEVCGPVPYAGKRSSWPWRQRDENAWVTGSKLSERYSDLPERSLFTDNRQSRRPKSTRPEIEKLAKSGHQFESVCNTKCGRCGRTSRQTPRTTSSRNAACRLQESQYLIGKSNGDDIFEEPTRDPLRRSKESRTPIYECKEKGLAIDSDDDEDDDDDDDDDKNDTGANLKSWGGKNSRETSNHLRRVSTRADDRHEDKPTLKTNKGYWAER